jgi:hypothetical protein
VELHLVIAVIADISFDNKGALLSLNISNNKLTQGEQDGTDDGGPKYKTDLSGKPLISHHGI